MEKQVRRLPDFDDKVISMPARQFEVPAEVQQSALAHLGAVALRAHQPAGAALGAVGGVGSGAADEHGATVPAPRQGRKTLRGIALGRTAR